MKGLLTAVLVLALATAGGVHAETFRQVENPSVTKQLPSFLGNVPDRFIVVLNDDVTIDHGKDMQGPVALAGLSGFAELQQQFQVQTLRPQFPGADKRTQASGDAGDKLSRYYKVTIGTGTLEEAMAAYAALPNVDHVEPIGVHTLFATPNDGYYDDPPPEYPYDQWHYWDTYGIRANTAWDSETGDQTVLVGNLDIGTMYNHGDLGGSNPPGPNDNSTNGNIWVNANEIPGNGIDDDGNGYIDDIIGWDFVDRTNWYMYACTDIDCGGADNDPSDGNGHGTHTAGTIAAITNNGYAVAGVAGGFGNGTFAGGGNGVKVVPCRIGYQLQYLGSPTGVVIMDYVAEAMYYMADLKLAGWNVASINCSFGSSNSGGLAAAADFLIAQDVVICVAAGNSSSSTASYLGSRGDCLDVAATNASGSNASFTNYGSWVDIAAPGVGILSTMTDPANPGVDYIAAMDGTSMACPHVAGVVALLESFNPSLTAAQKIAIITDPANTNTYSGSRYLGAGIIDARKCLDAAGAGCDLAANCSGTPTTGCTPLAVQFTDLSTGTGIDGWSWAFGDGGSSNSQNPSHTYNAAGTYSVSLTVSSSTQGCNDQVTKSGYITVSGAPVANFSGTPTGGEYPLTVQFTDASTGNPTSWSWDFGDGVGTSSAQNPSYTYQAAGTYTVSLTAYSACGSDVETKVDYITVTEPGTGGEALAQADLPVSGTVSGTYTATHYSDDSRQSIREIESGGRPQTRYTYLEHKWSFSVPQSTALTFYMEGYRNNNTDGDNFVFSYSTDNSNFTNLFTVNSATETVYSATIPNTVSGTVYIRVIDTDRTSGNRSLDYIYVDHMYISYSTAPVVPVADFSGTPRSGNYPLTVQFTDLSSGSPTSWSWNFGDGVGTSTSQNPSYTYQSAGTYTVSLTASNANGSDIETKTGYITVTAPSPPVANFSSTPTSGNYPLAVQFTDRSTGSPTSWSWDFGDGVGTSTSQNPSYTYQSAGTFTVSLTATNAYGSDIETKAGYITVTEPTQNSMHVANLTIGRKTAGPNCNGTCTVVIQDSNNQPVANATVYLTATGPVGGNFTAATDAAGSAFVETGKTRSCSGEWCFEVTHVTHTSYIYNAAANAVTKACESGWVYGVGDPIVMALPSEFGLDQNNPNPFNPTTEIAFSLPTPGQVRMEVFNVVGQRVAVLADGSFGAGRHVVTWDASQVSSGMYFYRLMTEGFVETKKMLLLK